MVSIHGHEVLQMMEGNSYTELSLLAAIEQRFGKHAKFHTCSKTDMNASELIAFLKVKAKFSPVTNTQFTVNIQKICHH